MEGQDIQYVEINPVHLVYPCLILSCEFCTPSSYSSTERLRLSDCGGRRSPCGKAAGAGLRVGAWAVTPGAVRCSAGLGDMGKTVGREHIRGANANAKAKF